MAGNIVFLDWVWLLISLWCLLQVMYLFLHTVKGTPFETPDQGKARLLTHWEQMDYGVQFTSSRKFLTISPIVLWVSFRFFKWSLVSFTQQILMQMIYYAALLHWLSGQICIMWSGFRFFFKKKTLIPCTYGDVWYMWCNSSTSHMWLIKLDVIIWKLLLPLLGFGKTLTAILSLQAHSCQFLHKIRSHTFPDQHLFPPQRPPPQIASVSWSSDIWDQQILTELTEHWIISTVVDLLTVGGSQKLTRRDCPVCLNCAVDKVCAAFKECRGAAVVSWKGFYNK